ncbi:hypothetical protein Plhal304r1_c017g0061541 [Plasmopara halstedii]
MKRPLGHFLRKYGLRVSCPTLCIPEASTKKTAKQTRRSWALSFQTSKVSNQVKTLT